jgi:hypothetical protein
MNQFFFSLLKAPWGRYHYLLHVKDEETRIRNFLLKAKDLASYGAEIQNQVHQTPKSILSTTKLPHSMDTLCCSLNSAVPNFALTNSH